MLRLVFSILLIAPSLLSFSQKEYKSLFWEVSGNGLEKPSYLYGTMHAQDSRVFNFKDGVMDAFNGSDSYAMELNMDSIDQGALMASLVMDSTHSLQTLLSKSDYKLVETFFRDSLGQALFMYNKMQPMFTSQLIAARDLKTQQEDALDLYFFKEAKKQKKHTIGLETMMEQVSAFSAIPLTKQAAGLVKAVKEYGKEDESNIENIMEHYVKGDLDKLLEITTKTEEDKELAKIFNETFIVKRNQNMADRSVPLMKKGSTFIAVGAAHLPGEDGVIELLRKKGYTVIAK